MCDAFQTYRKSFSAQFFFCPNEENSACSKAQINNDIPYKSRTMKSILIRADLSLQIYLTTYCIIHFVIVIFTHGALLHVCPS